MFANGRDLELSRRFAIYICALLFLIAVCSGAIFWAHRSSGVKPYFLYVSGTEWSVFSANKNEEITAAPWHRLLMESIAVRFASDYMRISNDPRENSNVLWCSCSGRCDIDPTECRICCASDTFVFGAFVNHIQPVWEQMFLDGEFMDLTNIVASPVGPITERGGMWRLVGTLRLGRHTDINRRPAEPVVIYMTIGRSGNTHARTFGFHVTGFNFYTGVR